jgi:acyl-CoA thioesterase
MQVVEEEDNFKQVQVAYLVDVDFLAMVLLQHGDQLPEMEV